VKLEKGRTRLVRIVDTGETTSPGEARTFGEFCKSQPVWGDKNKSYVVFRDHPAYNGENVFVERIQHSGLCYMHAPIVLQHYLVRMNSKEPVMMLWYGHLSAPTHGRRSTL